jgi:rubrerythrin
MANPNASDEPARDECDCFEQALAAFLEGEWSHLEGLGQLRQVTCRGCGTTFLTNHRTADLCPACQERQSAIRQNEAHELGG